MDRSKSKLSATMVQKCLTLLLRLAHKCISNIADGDVDLSTLFPALHHAILLATRACEQDGVQLLYTLAYVHNDELKKWLYNDMAPLLLAENTATTLFQVACARLKKHTSDVTASALARFERERGNTAHWLACAWRNSRPTRPFDGTSVDGGRLVEDILKHVSKLGAETSQGAVSIDMGDFLSTRSGLSTSMLAHEFAMQPCDSWDAIDAVLSTLVQSRPSSVPLPSPTAASAAAASSAGDATPSSSSPSRKRAFSSAFGADSTTVCVDRDDSPLPRPLKFRRVAAVDTVVHAGDAQ